MEYDIKAKYYITKENGGWSPCISGNNASGLRPFDGSVLPNCVGWATGRFNELLKLNECKYLGNRNAVDFTKWCDIQGLKYGQVPVVGACMVWGHGEGHVAIVEKVVSETEVITSESGWSYRSAPIVRSVTRKKGANGRWGYSYEFLMFIYPPNADIPKYYTVKRGDTLTKIANMFGVTVAQLVEWNDIKNPNLIITGQVLIVGKGDEPEPVIYRVKLGDNLTKIARKFNTTVDKLVKDNHIKNRNLIFVGQKLIIK